MRKNKLENLVFTGKKEGKREKGRHRKQIADQRKNWLTDNSKMPTSFDKAFKKKILTNFEGDTIYIHCVFTWYLWNRLPS